jgi:hypothetical protein
MFGSDTKKPLSILQLSKISCILITVSSLFTLILTVYGASKFNFYYFNPDSVQSNFSQLTKGFSHFFNQQGVDASFQAFSQKGDFDRKVKEERPALVLVPSWYFQQYGKALGLQPLLTSLENGKPNYTKILLVRKSAPFTVQELKGRTVAMTTMGPKTEELLNNTLFRDQGVDFSAMNIIETPKDADALYALALGQVDAALVGRSTLEAISSANKNITGSIQAIASSTPVPMPLLCTLEGTMDEMRITQVKQKFQDGVNNGSLPNYMKMLNINGWQNVF